ncbi:signal peptidase I [Candidatus Sumerlaeota bacterium]|nr:signal peptidase I [Candidatus Sumerlaeota bacterium]
MAIDPETGKTKISSLRKWIGFAVFFVLAGVVGALASGRLENYRVSSGSMLPTLEVGDCLLVDSRRPVVPQRGDIVAFYNPENAAERLVKRVVAGPGDRVRFEDGLFYLNDEPQYDEDYVTIEQIEDLPYQKPVTLDLDQYYVLGDNRAYSVDSMNFGPITPDDMIGVVKYIYWPKSRMRAIHNPNGV